MRRVLGLHCVKRLSATLHKAGRGEEWGGGRREGVGGMRHVFLHRGNQTNWIWSIAVPLGRACCLQRQCDTADPRHADTKRRWLDNNRVVETEMLLFELSWGRGGGGWWVEIERSPYGLYLYKHQHKPPNVAVYQTDAASRRSDTVMAAAKEVLPLSLCKVDGFLESSRQIEIDTDRRTDTQAEPLCAVVLTTEREQHPGLLENQTWEGVNSKKRKSTA